MIRKPISVSKFITLPYGKQIITTNILPSIARNKGTQTIKFGQLIEYNAGNIFLQNSYIK